MYQYRIRAVVLSTFMLLSSIAGAADELSVVDTTPGKPPSDAIVIFDGKNTDMLVNPHGGACNWPVEDGAVTVDPKKQGANQGLWTKLHFRDAQIHVEFRVWLY